MNERRSDIKPFKIDISEADIDYLKRRLTDTRFPEEETVDDWNQGVPLDYAKEFIDYWLNDYDWYSRQALLNKYPQYQTNIDGLDIHFIHVPSPHPKARALILSHGWPSSFVEFIEVIEPLINPPNPKDAFHVVCPSLPGYGFSGKPNSTGWGVQRIASAWDELMRRLGYDKYYAQGGDWGAAVTTAIGMQNNGACKGIHLSAALANPPKDIKKNPDAADMRAFFAIKQYKEWGQGYMKQQSTRPQTLGYGLNDSPVGQAMWIIEKFYEWSDCSGQLESVLSKDKLLDNIMCYWLPGNSASSARLYWENRDKALLGSGEECITIPSAFSMFPKEILLAPRRWAETRYKNIVYWNEVDKGGHFAAFEQPALFVEELQSAFGIMKIKHGAA